MSQFSGSVKELIMAWKIKVNVPFTSPKHSPEKSWKTRTTVQTVPSDTSQHFLDFNVKSQKRNLPGNP